jgi:lipopolysaccharide export system permease protein
MMGAILNRYVFRETALTWIAVTGVLLLILLTNQFASVLDDAAGAQLPKNAIFAVMGLSSIQYLTILIPVGIFIAIMLALARMYRDSEMAALMACGIGNIALYRPIILLSSLLALVAGWLALDAGPSALRQVQMIAEEAKKTADLAILEPGRFLSFGRQQAILYAEQVNDDGSLSNVFVQLRRQDKVIVVVAEKAGQRNDPELSRKVLTFVNGERYEGVPGSGEFQVMKFAEHGIPFEIRESKSGDVDIEARSFFELLEQMDAPAVAELQWRLSVPITLMVLTLIAVPLSRAPPRQGRYNNLIVGILMYIIYANLLGASKVWLEKDAIPAWLGLWWVHLLFIGYAIFLLMRQNNMFSRLYRRARRSAVHSADS